jgi:DNA-binding IclR family transcriptional regulator
MNEARVPGQQSVQRAIDVLFCFGPDSRALSAADVAVRTGMNRTTAWRYLQSLASSGLVRPVGDGRFGLGARVVGLAEAYTSQWGELEAVAGAALVRLRDRVGETAALHLRQGWSRVVIRQVESRHELHRTYRELGQPIPLLAGAPSLAILAALPDDERATYLDAHVDAPAERRRLEERLRAIRDAGFARTRGSRVPDVASVAAVIRDGRGEPVAAVNVTGPDHRLPEERVEEVAAEVTAAATWIEASVGDPTGSPRPT